MYLKGKSKLLTIGLAAVILGSTLLGCQEKAVPPKLPLSILGDVGNPLTIASLAEAPATRMLEYREETIQVIPLGQLIQEAEPWGDKYEILFIAADGFSAVIGNEDLAECYLAQSRENGWEAINLRHPVSSNIKRIEEIVIVSRDLPVDNCFSIIEPGRNIARLSAGYLYKNGYSIVSTVRGTATVEHQGQELTATTYYRQKVIDIEDYVNLAGRDSVLVIGEKGETEVFRQDGRFLLADNGLGYLAGDELVIPRAKGIVLNPPERRITDVYSDALAAMEEGIPLLLILVDGLGYHQYQHASAQGYTPFLDTLPEPELAMSVYPSITAANLAASLSGALPHVNGVLDNRTRQLDVPTFFERSSKEGKAMTAVWGPVGTIQLEIEPVLNVDRNGDGSTDDEKTDYALGVIAEDYDLLFVHYKDVDSAGQDFGDLHQLTLEEIRETDEYIRQLVEKWRGRVLIYADHGMYATETGGSHGALASESMFTPYWLFETGE
ncbi:MAG: alkaline phosphatase family protein [Bacillota bacterium]|jgi:hypothetical protein